MQSIQEYPHQIDQSELSLDEPLKSKFPRHVVSKMATAHTVTVTDEAPPEQPDTLAERVGTALKKKQAKSTAASQKRLQVAVQNLLPQTTRSDTTMTQPISAMVVAGKKT